MALLLPDGGPSNAAALRVAAADVVRQGGFLTPVIRRALAQNGSINQGGFGAVLRAADTVSGASAVLKGLAGATTGMRSVRQPRDLLNREANAALALGSIMPTTKGAIPAVAITTKATQLRKALGLQNNSLGARAGREAAELADMPMIPLTRNVRDLLAKTLPRAKPGQIEKGGTYFVPDAKSKFGQFVSDRTAIIQDPETGTMFVAPGLVHGELAEYVGKNFPQYRRSPTGWLQHEVYDSHPGYGPAGSREAIPARLMHGRVGSNLGFGELVSPDTELATIARAQLIQNLRRLGVVGDTKKAAAQRKALLARR